MNGHSWEKRSVREEKPEPVAPSMLGQLASHPAGEAPVSVRRIQPILHLAKPFGFLSSEGLFSVACYCPRTSPGSGVLPARFNSPLKKPLCRRGRAIVAEDKARNRVPSYDSARARNVVFRPQGPAAVRMGFFNGLLSRLRGTPEFCLRTRDPEGQSQ